MPRNRAMAAVAAVTVLGVLAAVALGATTGGTGDAQIAAIKADTAAVRAAIANKDHGLKELKREVKIIEAHARQLGVEVQVNETACAAAPVQCGDGGTGHTFAPAASTNHNPVQIAVLVTRNGAPRAGLGSAAFDFSNQFVPAGGAALTRCPAGGAGCASPGDLFQNGGDGVYLLWVHPSPAGSNWKTGSYYSRVTVTDPAGRKGSALVEITVP